MSKHYDPQYPPELPEVSWLGQEKELTPEIAKSFLANQRAGLLNRRYTIAFIDTYLRTDEQRRMLNAMDLTVDDILNGRFSLGNSDIIESFFADWNARLGAESFGF